MSDDDNVVRVDPDIETICCDGRQDELGHPAVFYTFDQSDKIVCSKDKIGHKNTKDSTGNLWTVLSFEWTNLSREETSLFYKHVCLACKVEL